MSPHGELTLHAGAAVQMPAQVEAVSMIQALQRAASDPHTDIGKMRELLAMAQELEKDRREVAYRAALGRIHAKCPRITQHGTISYNATAKIKYSLFEDIDAAIRPLLEEEGMSLSWDTVPPVETGKVRVVGELSHFEGHKERKTVEFPPDTSGGKTPIQAHASAIKYGRRHICKMFFNVIEGGEPDAEEGKAAPITEDQARTLASMIEETKSNRAGFLKYLGIDKLSDLKASRYGAAVAALEAKRRTAK